VELNEGEKRRKAVCPDSFRSPNGRFPSPLLPSFWATRIETSFVYPLVQG